ncbi:MAG: hypothetical protein II047_01675 [Bacteroidales bacterium]|nr:hypothetical protein [Bacteroidales bacterium]
MKTWKKVVLGIVATPFVLAALLGVVYVYQDSIKKDVKEGYNQKIETGGDLESKYLLGGDLKVKRCTFKEEKPISKVSVFYPEEMETSGKKYPMILVMNGTGGKVTKYEPVFRMYASWGFIVVGTQDKGTGTGKTTVKVLNNMLDMNRDSGSVFYNRIDTENIGLTGFSQGGAGVFNVLTKYEEGKMIKAAAPLSPVSEYMTSLVTDYTYDSSLVECPIMILCGTEGEFETEIVIPLEELVKQYDKISSPKVMARRTGMDHGMMMSYAGGYVMAWFRWQLQGDEVAAMAFMGESPELLRNSAYQDQRIAL